MKKKKILFIMHELKAGGAEKLCVDILKRFDYSRFDVTLLLIQKEGVYLEQVPQQVKLLSLSESGVQLPAICNSRYLRNTSRRLLLWAKLPKFSKFDTIVSFMEGESLRYHSLITSKAKKNISWVHIDLFENHWSKRYFWDEAEELRAYHQMDKTIFVSRQAKEAFGKLFPTITQKDVILNLIDTEEIRAKADAEVIEKPDGFVIVGVGRLVDQKRFDRFIDVIAELQRRGHNVHGWIIGDGYLKEELQRKSQTVKNITLFGFKKNPLPYVKAADLFLCSSDNEGFSLVVAEALSLGKPVVSTAVTGPVELLSNDAGFLTGFEVSEIADVVEGIIVDEQKRQSYSSRAIERSKIFDVEATMRNIYSVVE